MTKRETKYRNRKKIEKKTRKQQMKAGIYGKHT
jgi:hypothetical protein